MTAKNLYEVKATVSLDEAANRLWDVVVVGAGPAGSVAARQIAQTSSKVLLVDRARFPRWKVCGCCLNAPALAALNCIGLASLPNDLGAQPLTRWQLCSRAGQVGARIPTGASLSRDALDAALIESAIASGAEFRDGTVATLLAEDDSSVQQVRLTYAGNDETACAKIVIAADGLGGQFLAKLPAFSTIVQKSARLGAGTILVDGPEYYIAGTIYMACGRGGYVGLVRLEDGRLDLAAAFDLAAVRQAETPAELAQRIISEAALPVPEGLSASVWRGTPALTRARSQVAANRLFVIGDAAGYIEPFTGEGMAWALASGIAVAPLAAAAAVRWSFELTARWTKQRQLLLKRRQRACRVLGSLLKGPAVTNLSVRVLRRAPWLAQPIIRAINRPFALLPEREVNLRTAELPDFDAGTGRRLG